MSESTGAGKCPPVPAATPATASNSWRGGGQGTKSRIRFTKSSGSADMASRPKAMSDPNLTAPVYFLVREQAKSVVAIKELQEQMRSIEEFKTDVIHALCDIQQHLSSENVSNSQSSYGNLNTSQVPSSTSGPYMNCSYSSTFAGTPVEKYVVTRATQTPRSSTYKGPSFLADSLENQHCISIGEQQETKSQCVPVLAGRSESTPSKQYTHSAAVQTSLPNEIVIKEAKDVTSTDSDKQDSGLDSDCRDQLTDTSHGPSSISGVPRPVADCYSPMDQNYSSKDELLYLLDAICQRGIALKAKADELERIKQQKVLSKGGMSSNGTDHVEVSDYMDYLERERTVLYSKLEQMEKERDELKKEVTLREKASSELSRNMKDMEYKLRLLVSEKQKVEQRLSQLNQTETLSGTSKAESWPIAGGGAIGGIPQSRPHFGDSSADLLLRRLSTMRSHQQGSDVTSGYATTEGMEIQNLLAQVLAESDDPFNRLASFDPTSGLSQVASSSTQGHISSPVMSTVARSSVFDILCLVGFYRMENSVLQNKVLRLESSLMDQNKHEEKLKTELEEFKKDKEKLAARLEENKCEQAALVSKVNMLERALQGVCQDSASGFSAGGKTLIGSQSNLPYHSPFFQFPMNSATIQSHSLPPMHNWYQKEPIFHMPSTNTNPFGVVATPPSPLTTQSTPPEQTRQGNKFNPSPRSNSFDDSFDIPCHQPGSDQRSSTPVTLTPFYNTQQLQNRGASNVTSSVRKHLYPAYRGTESSRDAVRLSDWESDSDLSQLNDSFLVDGQVVRNREVDMDSIRSEFDPLTKDDDDNRVQDFVDSLDIPIKMTTPNTKVTKPASDRIADKNVTDLKKSTSESQRYCGIPRPGRILDASSFKISGSKKQSNIRHIQNMLGRLGADKEPLL